MVVAMSLLLHHNSNNNSGNMNLTLIRTIEWVVVVVVD
jgi:hypothetical protein